MVNQTSITHMPICSEICKKICVCRWSNQYNLALKHLNIIKSVACYQIAVTLGTICYTRQTWQYNHYHCERGANVVVNHYHYDQGLLVNYKSNDIMCSPVSWQQRVDSYHLMPSYYTQIWIKMGATEIFLFNHSIILVFNLFQYFFVPATAT